MIALPKALRGIMHGRPLPIYPCRPMNHEHVFHASPRLGKKEKQWPNEAHPRETSRFSAPMQTQANSRLKLFPHAISCSLKFLNLNKLFMQTFQNQDTLMVFYGPKLDKYHAHSCKLS